MSFSSGPTDYSPLSMDRMLSVAEWFVVAGFFECVWVGREWLYILHDKVHPHHGASLQVWMRLLKIKLVAFASGSWLLGLLLSLTNPGFYNAGQEFVADSELVIGPKRMAALLVTGAVARAANWWATGSIVFCFEGVELMLLCCFGMDSPGELSNWLTSPLYV